MNEMERYSRLDGCYGVVTSRCGSGTFLLLDNGFQEAFAYGFTSLYPGSSVLCTVQREESEGRRTLVSIDAVVFYGKVA